jgi:hypothetical protein
MSRVIALNNFSFQSNQRRTREISKGQPDCSRVLFMRGKKNVRAEFGPKGGSRIVFLSLVSGLIFLILAAGAFYLYQTNDLATKGYEIKDMENRIQVLEKENKKMKIREVELRSMYNIEKSTQNLNLENPINVTYVEMDSSVAMN